MLNAVVYRLFTDNVLQVHYEEKELDKARTLITLSLIVDKDKPSTVEPIFSEKYESLSERYWNNNTNNPHLLNMIKEWLQGEYAYQSNPLMDNELIAKFFQPNNMKTIHI